MQLVDYAWHAHVMEFITRQALVRSSLPYISPPHAAYLQVACAHHSATALETDTSLWHRLAAQLSQSKDVHLLSLFIEVPHLSAPCSR